MVMFPRYSSIVLLLPVLCLYGQDAGEVQQNFGTWFVTASLGSPIVGPAWSIGDVLKEKGYNKKSISNFFTRIETEHPHSQFDLFDEVPWSASLHFRITGNTLAGAAVENSSVVSTVGFDGQKKIEIHSFVRTYSASVSFVSGSHPGFVRFGAGPALHHVFAAPQKFSWSGITETYKKFGFTAYTGVFAMINDTLFLDVTVQFRYVGSVTINGNIIGSEHAQTLPAIDANFNHLFSSVGIGASF